MRTVEIIEMSQHFLYLPFYYAKEQSFFGYVGKDYQTDLAQAFPQTDEGSLARLLHSEKDDVIRFALCDPSPLLDMEIDESDPPAVVAAMITNAAIWAIDKEADPVQTFSELRKFENIIAFERGTTTFGMARRLVGEKNLGRVLEVAPGQELIALEKYKNAVAFSPEILDAVSAIEQRKTFKIILPLGTTREYDNVLVTALITRRSIAEKHPALVSGMVAALQRAILEVSMQSEQVVSFAAKRFNRKRELVSLALGVANDAAVYPPNIVVQRNHWEAAARSHCEEAGKTFDAATKLRSRNLYDMIARPYVGSAKAAMQHVIHETAQPKLWDSRRVKLSIFAGLGLAGVAAIVVLALLVSPLLSGLLMVFGLWGVFATHRKRPQLKLPMLILHFVMDLACAPLVYLIFVTSSAAWQTVYGILAGTVLAFDYQFVFGSSEK